MRIENIRNDLNIDHEWATLSGDVAEYFDQTRDLFATEIRRKWII